MCDMCEFAAAGDEPPRIFTASGDSAIGDFAADGLIEGAKILQVDAPDAVVIDASGHS